MNVEQLHRADQTHHTGSRLVSPGLSVLTIRHQSKKYFSINI